MSHLLAPTIIVEWETSRECGDARAAVCLAALREQLQNAAALFHGEPELLLVADPGENERAEVERAVANAAGDSGWPVIPRVVQPPTRLDYYQKKNFGLSASSNPIVVFMDSDVRPETGWMEALLRPFHAAAVSVVAGRTHAEAGTLYERAVALFWIFPARAEEDVLRPATCFWANSFAIRRQLNLCNLVWINAIDDAARTRKVSVLLTGLRGNAGFSYTGTTLLPQLLRQLRLIALARHWTALLRGGTRAGTLASQTFGPLLPQPLWRLVLRARGRADGVTGYTNLTEEVLQELDIEKRAAERGLDLSYRPRFDGVSERLWMLRRGDVGNDNKGALAGWGIDRRDPTADRRLVEFCLRVPAEQYLAGGAPRGFARRALADRLPPEILVQRRKGLQAVDWHEGLTAAKAELQQEVDAIGELPESLGMVAVARMKTAIRNWPASADWRKARTVERYRLALLRGVAVGHFLRRASGSNG